MGTEEPSIVESPLKLVLFKVKAIEEGSALIITTVTAVPVHTY